MVLQELVKQRDNCVGPLPCVERFIYQVIYLMWESFAANSKQQPLPWGVEVDGTRVMGVVDLRSRTSSGLAWDQSQLVLMHQQEEGRRYRRLL